MSKDTEVESWTSQADTSARDRGAAVESKNRVSTRTKVLAIVFGILSLFLLYLVVQYVYCKLYPLECLDVMGRTALEKQGFTPRMVAVDDVVLRVWDSGGAGQPMVLVHGQLFSSTVFCRRAFGQTLRKLGYRLVLLDLPGHGESPAIEGELTLGRLRELLAGFLDTEKLERPVLVGHGLGGWLAALVALDRPEALRVLVLIEPDGIAPPGPDDPPRVPTSRKQWRAVLRKANPRNRERTLGNGALDALLERSRKIGLEGLYASARPGDYIGGSRLAGLQVPLALIWGEENLLDPPADGRALAAQVPGARFRVVPKSGSGPFVVRPASTARVIIEVLAALKKGTEAAE